MVLVFVRHGERVDKLFHKSMLKNQVECDPTLTQDGKQQATDIGKKIRDYIKKEKSDYELDEAKIVSSPFIRTMQTAAYISKSLVERQMLTIAEESDYNSEEEEEKHEELKNQEADKVKDEKLSVIYVARNLCNQLDEKDQFIFQKGVLATRDDQGIIAGYFDNCVQRFE